MTSNTGRLEAAAPCGRAVLSLVAHPLACFKIYLLLEHHNKLVQVRETSLCSSSERVGPRGRAGHKGQTTMNG